MTDRELQTMIIASVLASAAHPAAPQDLFREVISDAGGREKLDVAIKLYESGGADALVAVLDAMDKTGLTVTLEES